jgi:hypothetical protein
VACTFTDTRQSAQLTLVKSVTNNDGGNAVASDWTLSASGPTPVSGATGTASVTNAVVDPGTYALSESGPAGYNASAWSCTGGSQSGSTITLTPGQSASCSITNDDVAPTLALNKTVVNDDGGNAVENDFVLSATPSTGTTITDAGGDVPATTAVANRVYTLSETGVTGYTASVWTCTGSGVHQTGSTVTLDEGATGSCSITNDDVAPTLKLVKSVTNDNGGNAVADDWTLFADAAVPNDDRNISNLGGSGVFETVYANTGYDLSESSGPSGYTAGSWSCTGGSLVGSTLTLNEGQTGIVCSITNDDVAPTLALNKTVVNDDGGNAVENDFVLSGTQ